MPDAAHPCRESAATSEGIRDISARVIIKLEALMPSGRGSVGYPGYHAMAQCGVSC